MGGDQLKRILFKGDKTIWIVFFIICSISWVEVFSATSRQINESGSYWLPIIKHTIFLAGGIVVVWIMHNMKVTWIKKLTHVIYWLGLAGLIWAQFDEGSKINDSARWIKIMGLTFQPMELAKMGLIMVTALITSQHQDEDGTDRFALKRIAIYGALPILIILKENLSTAVIILLTLYAMMFVSRYPKKQMLYILAAAFAVCIMGITAIMSAPKSWANEDGFKQKVITWQNRIIDARKREPVTAENYVIKNEQRTYANIAIASSHIFGCGPGNSKQRDFIPHAYSDFIYAIIIEELGLAGGIIVLLLYMTILYRCGKIANKCEDPYPAFLVMGIGMIITLQALLHMYISVGDFVTGQPLPLISQGGTSVIINCVYIGMILSISRYAKKASANPKQSLEESENDNMNENIKLS
ncbi:MAG: FtsW/RodA/SpoVE family cell cycle protein [Bacteroidaceae bacterium]|nr:FtsW/RodA/SpoVE family cell cycle protein [Bacteroidaceae bacterium]